MRNGFITPIFSLVVCFLRCLNAVEWFKEICGIVLKPFWRSVTEKGVAERARKSVGIDIFQVSKWVCVIVLIKFEVTGNCAKWFIWYLIASNLFTYFYYHVWDEDSAKERDIVEQRRRFLFFSVAFLFSLVCFAYLLQFHYAVHFEWPEEPLVFANSLYLSMANALTLTYGDFSIVDDTGRILVMLQLGNSVAFLTIIVANSIPRI